MQWGRGDSSRQLRRNILANIVAEEGKQAAETARKHRAEALNVQMATGFHPGPAGSILCDILCTVG